MALFCSNDHLEPNWSRAGRLYVSHAGRVTVSTQFDIDLPAGLGIEPGA